MVIKKGVEMSGREKSVREKRIDEAFNSYNGKNPKVLDEFYDPEIVFEDPITKVSGVKELKDYYKHAYASVKEINFNFLNIVSSSNNYTCEWEMTLRVPSLNFGKAYSVRGVSVLTFSEKTDKVIKHHDYLDLGDMVYERIPLIGKAVKFAKSKLS